MIKPNDEQIDEANAFLDEYYPNHRLKQLHMEIRISEVMAAYLLNTPRSERGKRPAESEQSLVGQPGLGWRSDGLMVPGAKI